MIAPPAPHAPYTSAPRHNETFENVKALRTPNFNMPSGPLGEIFDFILEFCVFNLQTTKLPFYYR